MRRAIVILILACPFSCKEKRPQIENQSEQIDTLSYSKSTDDSTNRILTGYDELANQDSLDRFVISEYNTDLQDVPNISRPSKSSIKDFRFHENELFKIWVEDPSPETPHATFKVTVQSFHMVDYDGDGDMKYEITNDSLVVYFNDFIQRGKIVDLNKDKLLIHWKNASRPTRYFIWSN